MIRAAIVALAGVAAGAASAAGPHGSMDPQQWYLFQHAYPDAEVIFDCEGNFSGASEHEHVLGIRRAGESPFRIGLVLDSGKWLFHDIERELKDDKLPARRWAYAWEAPPGAASPKCNAKTTQDADLSDGHGKALGYKPLFAVRRGRANACFATSRQYNNWDCVAYGKGQFRLWYQQVFAD